jgi:hypothetical protein
MALSKGSIYASVRLFVEQKYGTGVLEECLAEMPPEDRALLESIVPVGWYPLEPVLELHRVIDRKLGKGDLALCREMGTFSSQWQMTVFHRLYLRFKTPHWLIQKAGTMWSNYHDTGYWEVEETGPNAVVARLNGFAVADEAFCARFHGWLLGIGSLTGVTKADITEPHCRARGGRYCEYVCAWT